MLLSELSDYLETEFTYPVETETVVERVGDVRIGNEATDDPETIESALAWLGPGSFESPDALYRTIYGNVGDDFIGRKYYDDRGGNPSEISGAPADEDHVSF